MTTGSGGLEVAVHVARADSNGLLDEITSTSDLIDC
jgi:hypothetical protein